MEKCSHKNNLYRNILQIFQMLFGSSYIFSTLTFLTNFIEHFHPYIYPLVIKFDEECINKERTMRNGPHVKNLHSGVWTNSAECYTRAQAKEKPQVYK